MCNLALADAGIKRFQRLIKVSADDFAPWINADGVV